jgi:succinate dehydrogenase/fumarate reductase flavoprotein subunit
VTATLPVYETDVLVIGGGLAALRAALTARRCGANVLVAVKRRLGQSGSSANTSGGYAAAATDLNPDDDPQQHFADTVVGGGWVNDRRMARALAEEAPARLRELWEIGAQFQRHDGRYYMSPSGDHRHARVLVPVHMRGTDMTLPLRAAVAAAGAELLENTVIAELLLDDGRVIGAVGIRRDRAEGCVIRAAATVLAAGGAGRMFPVTSNPVDVTGGGYALALRAGAPLRDMEFIQFYPWRCIRPFRGSRVPIQPSTFVSGAKLYNSRGERFMEAYDPVRTEATTRDVAARGIFDQIRFGLSVDGGVLLDISGVADEQFRLENGKVIERLEPRGIHYRDIPLIIAPEAHFMMGGVVTDEWAAAPLTGLYACGENAGGTHGGNRLNSNAVPETQVFGHRAGRSAAEAARSASRNGRLDERQAKRWAERLSRVRSDTADASPEMDAILAHLQHAMELGLGIVRTADQLKMASAEADAIRERVESLPQESIGDLVAAMELEDMCDVAQACAASALLRTESRAAHYRDDCPNADPEWVRTVVYEGGEARVVPLVREPDEEALLAPEPPRPPTPQEFVE